MTADLLTRAPRTNSADGSLPPAGRGRRWRLLAGVLVVAASMAGFVAWNVSATDTTPVLAVARPVSMGQVLTSADVRVVDVRLAPGVAVVPAGEVGSVVGRPAAVSLSPGGLLAPGQVGPAAVPAAGEVLVAVQVPLPPAGLAPGSRVRVLVTPTGATGGATGAGGEPVVLASAAATVVELGPVDGNGALVVSLLLRVGDGEPVATAAAVGRVVLVVEAAGG
ncbi:MAG: SAF domain-containing protein [Natronosporangium sp.]